MRIFGFPWKIVFLVFGKKGPVLNALLQSVFHLFFNRPSMYLCPLFNGGTIYVIFFIQQGKCRSEYLTVMRAQLTILWPSICLIYILYLSWFFLSILQKKCSSEYLAVKRVHLSRQLSILWQRRTPVMCFHPSRGGGWGYFSFTIQNDTKYSKYCNGNKQKY